jgi:thiamine pyrophosphokinase
MPAEGVLDLANLPPASAGGFLQAVIFANGDFVPPADLQARLAAAHLVIAADGGAEHCRAAGQRPDVVIGDLDSLKAELRSEFEEQGVQVIRHPVAKDETDLELALLHAKGAGATQVTVFAGLGGRWDHSLANLLLASQPAMSDLRILFVHGEERLFVVREYAKLDAAVGERVSLLPLVGDAIGVTTEGLSFPLKNETLCFGSSRGVSNTVARSGAQVRLVAGCLLCVISPADRERRS